MSEFSFKIALSGPSRVGKTSLVTTFLAQAQSLLAETPVSITPEDGPTEKRLNDNRDDLKACLFSPGEFNVASLGGTQNKTIYKLVMKVGKSRIRFDLLDFPGGWLNPEERSQVKSDWEFCEDWMAKSAVLLIPIEATLVMEAMSYQREIRKTVRNLQISKVETMARTWAKRRAEAGEPGLVIFAPVKCETYFPDNDGFQDKSGALYDRAMSGSLYGGVRRAIEEEMDSCSNLLGVEYHPVGTLGCVDFCTGKYKEDDFHATYERRSNAEWNPYGADGILISLAKFAALGDENAERGVLSAIWRFLSGEQKALLEAIRQLAEMDYPKNAKVLNEISLG